MSDRIRTEARQPVRQALIDSLPLAVSIATYGTVFGALARQTGLNAFAVLAMSTLVMSGSAQFVALPLLQSGAGPGELFVTTALLSLRHLIMGLSLVPWVRGLGLGHRLLLALGLNDEAYALTTGYAARHGFNPRYMLGVGAVTFLTWMVSTTVGALLGSLVEDPRRLGFDFAFLAVFIALLVPQIRGWVGLAAATGAAVVALATAPLIGTGGGVLAAALTAAAVGGALDRD